MKLEVPYFSELATDSYKFHLSIKYNRAVWFIFCLNEEIGKARHRSVKRSTTLVYMFGIFRLEKMDRQVYHRNKIFVAKILSSELKGSQ